MRCDDDGEIAHLYTREDIRDAYAHIKKKAMMRELRRKRGKSSAFKFQIVYISIIED